MSADLRENLQQGNKQELLDETKKISDLANFTYLRQKGPYGNATPLINAEHLVEGEPFIFAFADDFVAAKPSRFKQLVEAHEKYGGSILTCVESDKEADYSKYAFITGEEKDGITAVTKIVEKPGSYEAVKSKTASVSGYLFEPELFKYLHEDLTKLEDDQEFIMQPSLNRMADDG